MFSAQLLSTFCLTLLMAACSRGQGTLQIDSAAHRAAADGDLVELRVSYGVGKLLDEAG